MVVVKIILLVAILFFFGVEVYGLIKALVERRKKHKEKNKTDSDNNNKEI